MAIAIASVHGSGHLLPASLGVATFDCYVYSGANGSVTIVIGRCCHQHSQQQSSLSAVPASVNCSGHLFWLCHPQRPSVHGLLSSSAASPKATSISTVGSPRHPPSSPRHSFVATPSLVLPRHRDPDVSFCCRAVPCRCVLPPSSPIVLPCHITSTPRRRSAVPPRSAVSSSYLRKSKYRQLQVSLQSQCERKNCKGFPLNTIPYAARPVSSLVLIPPRHAARPPSSSCFVMRCGILCCCVASILVTCEQFRRYGRLYMRSSCMPIVPGRSQRDCGSLSGCRSSLGSLGMGGGGAVVLEADIVGGCCLRVCSFWRTGPTESKFGQCSGT